MSNDAARGGGGVSAADAVTPELVARLERLLDDRLTDVHPMPGGHSGITLMCTAESRGPVVVKVAAPGRPAVGRHDVLRQARAMAQVGPHVPAPEVILVEDGEQPLAVVSFAAGAAVEPAIDDTGADLPEALVRQRFDVVTHLLADLHRVDPRSAGCRARDGPRCRAGAVPAHRRRRGRGLPFARREGG